MYLSIKEVERLKKIGLFLFVIISLILVGCKSDNTSADTSVAEENYQELVTEMEGMKQVVQEQQATIDKQME